MVPRTHAEMTSRNDASPHPKATNVAGLAYTPERPKPLPAVLLLSDAGARDQDGDPMGTGDVNAALLKHLAVGLGEVGVASFRCDKRGVEAVSHGHSPPNPNLRELTADARAELAALRAEPAVDPHEVGVVGHGEGALVASLAAASDGKVRGVALLAAAGRPLDAMLLEQAEVSLRRFGYPEEEVRSSLDSKRALYEAVRTGKPLPRTLSQTELRAVRSALGWMRGHFATDPAAVVARLGTVPILVAQGNKDGQLSATDYARLHEALSKAGNELVTVKTYNELGHTFARVSADSLTDDMGPRTDVDPEFLDDTSAFMRGALVAKPSPAPIAAATSPTSVVPQVPAPLRTVSATATPPLSSTVPAKH
jgi:hypothetical protein